MNCRIYLNKLEDRESTVCGLSFLLAIRSRVPSIRRDSLRVGWLISVYPEDKEWGSEGTRSSLGPGANAPGSPATGVWRKKKINKQYGRKATKKKGKKNCIIFSSGWVQRTRARNKKARGEYTSHPIVVLTVYTLRESVLHPGELGKKF